MESYWKTSDRPSIGATLYPPILTLTYSVVSQTHTQVGERLSSPDRSFLLFLLSDRLHSAGASYCCCWQVIYPSDGRPMCPLLVRITVGGQLGSASTPLCPSSRSSYNIVGFCSAEDSRSRHITEQRTTGQTAVPL